jgi:hypothetical protein
MVNRDRSLLAAMALSAASCGYLIDAAKVRQQFATDHSCPPARVTVRELPLPAAPVVAREPPPEIAADPERLELWRESERARQERIRQAQQDDLRMFEVQGCEVHETLTCSRYRQRGRWPCATAP